jgi:uncharacterized protein YqfA (UPF0365 family)
VTAHRRGRLQRLRTLWVPFAFAAAVLPTVDADAAAVPSCRGVPATIVATAHAERLVGTAARDVIVARGGDGVACHRCRNLGAEPQ